MTITFRPAKLDKTPLLIGLAGPSGSGKTYSALRLAKGIANGGKIVMIDTEARRGLHYAKMFQYEHGELKAPFRPESYLAAIEAAAKAGASVIIIDSMSHEHEGQGGILEWQQEEVNRMAGEDYAKRERVKFAAWIKPKSAHNKFVNTMLQNPIHVIFCFRAKDKLELKTVNGKQVPVEAGWQPICADRLEYEMTCLLVLPPGAQGVPDLTAKATKLQEQHKSIIKPGQQLTEAVGAALAAWANGDTGISSKPPTGEGGANQGNLSNGDSGGVHVNVKVANPPPALSPSSQPSEFCWKRSDGQYLHFRTIEQWTEAVLSGASTFATAQQAQESLDRNQGILEEMIAMGDKKGRAADDVIDVFEGRISELTKNILAAG